MIKKHLPSKKFIFLSLAVCLVLFFSLFGKKIISFTQKEGPATKGQKIKIGDVVLSDHDGDGLYDWEETLWGTDPKDKDTFKNGLGDKKYVDDKKKDLGIENENSETAEVLTETEKISREMFSVVLSLNQKNMLTDKTIESLSSIFSQQILSEENELQNPEKEIKIQTMEDSLKNKNLYQERIIKIVDEARESGVGYEVGILSILDETEENFREDALKEIAKSYLDFANNMLNTPAPKEIAEIHQRIIAESIRINLSLNLIASSFLNDPVTSTRGLVFYKKYSDSLDELLYSLLSYFQ